MIQYRFKEISVNNEKFVLVELLDYDSTAERSDAFDTLLYNHSQSWGQVPAVMQDKKTFPSPWTYQGRADLLYNQYKQGTSTIIEKKWEGPLRSKREFFDSALISWNKHKPQPYSGRGFSI